MDVFDRLNYLIMIKFLFKYHNQLKKLIEQSEALIIFKYELYKGLLKAIPLRAWIFQN